jgi:outer membrane immunogenic protein
LPPFADALIRRLRNWNVAGEIVDMRKWLASAAIAALGVTSAAAADLSRPVYTKAPPAPVAAFDWTGFYIGANIGYGWANGDATTDGVSGSETLNGVLGGGQIGYNWQAGNWVFGIEADGQGTDQKASLSASALGLTVTENDSIPWFVTVRGRIGYAIAPMYMIYATGGGAWMDFKSNIGVTGLVTGAATTETTHGGWAAGAGIEGALSRNWSWKAEYLHVDTGTFNTTINLPLGLTAAANVRLTDDIGRFGINYRF